ncbi:probable cytochrome P450 6a17 isoform X2 [Tribolium madens]|uniref:probable cytochrome P450 6a17 isoform X2 n=1 Tax=Tribolium madens TaxID=41895 RepID=UPI001CF74DAA|nr:probable cytochrome P450 6a17 isoform X2 [Tribolium madens]
MLITTSLTSYFIALFLVILCYYYFKCFYYSYWERRNIPNLQPYIPGPKTHLGLQLKHLYDVMKEKKWKHGGFYQQLSPVYIISDLNYVKNVMTRDFYYFPHRGLYFNEKSDPLSAHIFNTSGPKWKHMRSKLNQIFTSSKLKSMFPILLDCEKNLVKNMEKHKSVDIKKVLDEFIGDIIEKCVFGFDCKIFRQFQRKILKRSRSRRLKVPRDASIFFRKLIRDTVDFRKKNSVTKPDFLQVLINLELKSEITIEEIAAQCFIFFIAGMSTSPTAMTFALYELARHQDIQEKVRQEIGKFDLTYDSLQEMRFLDQVFDEALRMYPPAAYLNRKCETDYEIPGTGIVLEKGTIVTVPVMGIHYDWDYYPNPENFDPDRFSEENRRFRPNFAFLPFGEGPRMCIGMRFGLIQSKLGLAFLLKRYKFTVSAKTQEPLKMKPNSLVLSAEGEIWLDVTEIKI